MQSERILNIFNIRSGAMQLPNVVLDAGMRGIDNSQLLLLLLLLLLNNNGKNNAFKYHM